MRDQRRYPPFIRELLRDPLILPFYVPSLVIFLGYGVLTPVLPLHAESFGVSYAWVGAVTSAQALGMLLTDLPSGLLLRRLGQKRAMILGMLLTILMRVAFMWAGSIHEAFVYRLLSGFGTALFGVARHAYITEHAAVANRGRAMALFGGLSRMGRLIGPLIGGFVAARWGLRLPFLIAGLISLPALLAVILFVPGGRSPVIRPVTAVRARAGGMAFLAMLRNQAALLLPAGIGQIFAQMIRSGRDTIIPLYASNAAGLDVEQVGLMMGIAAAVEMAAFPLAGWLMDNVGRKYSFVPSFAIQAVAMACVPLTRDFLGLLACTTLMGFANGASSGGMMTLGADLAPANARGEFLGVWRLIGDMGGFGGPALIGVVADALALPAAALAMASASLAGALTFGLLLPETLQRDDVESQSKSLSISAGGEAD